MCHRKNMCQEGYFLHTDGFCYLIEPLPCPYNTTVPTTTTDEITTEETTTEEITPEETTTEETTIEPPSDDADEQVRCPPGSVYFDEQCRRIICSRGEYHAGRCLSPACPHGTVWRNKSCQPSGYITTILEIDNVIKNKHKYKNATENVSHVEYVTPKPYEPNRDNSFETTTWWTRPQPELTIPTTTPAYSSADPSSGCCLVRSPRFCRPYAPTWICFNHSHRLCDKRICTHPVIYLKPPEIVQLTDPPLLVMPPNPPLSSCLTPDCHESEMINCSGCAQGLRETCSSSCYNYFCPGDACEFKKSEEFCELYPGGFGCKKSDGCIWKWCNGKCR
ncbi:GH14582 [Drosophila grimshawi]|uniref:GH14582 n=2 Tax=Drosophila grimshawi TaxID=7222 RepID=B4JV16_DROGR|nr:GH14582 [Drosophila grimshawi]